MFSSKLFNLKAVMRKQANPECGTDSALDSLLKSLCCERKEKKKGRGTFLP